MDNFEAYYRYTSKHVSGIPPISFVGDGNSITDYTIYGAEGGVGTKTAQLLQYVEQGGLNDDGTFNDSANVIRSNAIQQRAWVSTCVDAGSLYIGNYYFFNADGSLKSAQSNLFGQKKGVVTPSGGTAYCIVTFVAENGEDAVSPLDLTNCMISYFRYEPHEPYGYKIPITCGGETVTIYLDSPLDVGDKVTYADTGVAIPTLDGENTLTVSTSKLPRIAFPRIGGEDSALGKFLKYKYEIAKGDSYDD